MEPHFILFSSSLVKISASSKGRVETSAGPPGSPGACASRCTASKGWDGPALPSAAFRAPQGPPRSPPSTGAPQPGEGLAAAAALHTASAGGGTARADGNERSRPPGVMGTRRGSPGSLGCSKDSPKGGIRSWCSSARARCLAPCMRGGFSAQPPGR